MDGDAAQLEAGLVEALQAPRPAAALERVAPGALPELMPVQEGVGCRLITELSQVDAIEEEWDKLAVATGTPMMAPACVRAWWRHLAPADAVPRIVAVSRGEQLIGVAPFYAALDRRGDALALRLPGIELAGRLAPLAAPGATRDVATALTRALVERMPSLRVATLEGAPLEQDWTGALRSSWPQGRPPVVRRYQRYGCPTVSLSADCFEDWLEGKSANFRGSMRRMRRKFAAAGGRTRSSTPESLQGDVETFVRLHASRWKGRGRSRFVQLGRRLAPTLDDIGVALLRRDGRFRLRVLELGGEPICAQLFLAAGSRVQYINGGWDERHARLKPAMLGILGAIEEAFARHEQVVDLGTGEQTYKQRFADADEPVMWSMLMPAGSRLPLTLLKTAPTRARGRVASALKSHLSDQQVNRLVRLRR